MFYYTNKENLTITLTYEICLLQSSNTTHIQLAKSLSIFRYFSIFVAIAIEASNKLGNNDEEEEEDGAEDEERKDDVNEKHNGNQENGHDDGSQNGQV